MAEKRKINLTLTITKNLIDYSYINLNVRVTAVYGLVVEKDKIGRNILVANFLSI